MPLFSYTIKDKLKKISKGTTQASSEESLRKYFHEKGYLVFSITKTNQDKDSKKANNSIEGIKIGVFLIIFALVGGSYLLIKLANGPSEKLNADINPVKLETIYKETVIAEMPNIPPEKIIPESKQNIVVNKTVPNLKPEQKEGVITIAFKSPKKTNSKDSEPNSSYTKAMECYYAAIKSNTEPERSKAVYKKAISMARKSLMGKRTPGEIKKLRAVIIDCRDKLRESSN